MIIKRFKNLYVKTTENVDNAEAFLQNDLESRDFDYDYILSEMKSKFGWGDIAYERIEDFEKSDYFRADLINGDDAYVEKFNDYMKDMDTGLVDDDIADDEKNGFDDNLQADIREQTPLLPIDEYEESVLNIKTDNNNNNNNNNNKNKISNMKIETEIETVIPLPLPSPGVGFNTPVESGCRILIINSCENENSNCTEGLKDNLDCDVKEINLYQLNIKDTKSEEEPKDGMDLIYNEVEGCDAIIFACDGKSMKTCVDRMCNHYKEGELKNIIFGAIFNSQSDSNQELINCVINDLKMIVNGDCICIEGDETSTDATNMALCITNLANSTTSLRTNNTAIEEDGIPEEVDGEIMAYGEFVDEKQVEDPNEQSLEDDLPEAGSDEHDGFIEDLKGEVSKDLEMMPFTEEEEEEGEDEKKPKKEKGEVSKDGPGRVIRKKPENDIGINPKTVSKKKPVTEEEEERLIDNLDGTITDINKGFKDTNKQKGNSQKWQDKDKDKNIEEEEELVVSNKTAFDYALPFSMFDDVWEKYQESNTDKKTFDEFVNEYNYDETKNIEYEEEYEIEEELEEEAEALEPDVPNNAIDSMTYDELLAMVSGTQTLSITELERVMDKIDEMDKTKDYNNYEDNYDYDKKLVYSENEEEIVEEEDVVNSDIGTMSKIELEAIIQNDDSISEAELDKILNRLAELEEGSGDEFKELEDLAHMEDDGFQEMGYGLNEYEEEVVGVVENKIINFKDFK